MDKCIEEYISNLNQNKKKSIFTMLTHSHKHENYHSDIIRYYLSYNIVIEKFIDWLNEAPVEFFDEFGGKTSLKALNKTIDSKLYKDIAIPEREAGNRDITIISNPDSEGKSHVIIIENKSNEAVDMDKQIEKYYLALKNKYVIDAILYLNKFFIKQPKDIDLWKYKAEICRRLIIATLYGENGFVQNVVDKVLEDDSIALKNNSDLLKVIGMSSEIKDFFYILVYGEYVIDDLEAFIRYIFLSDISDVFYEKYNDTLIPYIRSYFMGKINRCSSDFSRLNYCFGHEIKKSYCVRFDVKKITYVIEFQFYNILNKELFIRLFIDEKNIPQKILCTYKNNILNKVCNGYLVNITDGDATYRFDITSIEDVDKKIGDIFAIHKFLAQS